MNLESKLARLEALLANIPAIEARLDMLLLSHPKARHKKPNAILSWLIMVPALTLLLFG